jgi:hypothetical protein
MGPIQLAISGDGLTLEEGENGHDAGIWVCFVRLAGEQVIVSDGSARFLERPDFVARTRKVSMVFPIAT